MLEKASSSRSSLKLDANKHPGSSFAASSVGFGKERVCKGERSSLRAFLLFRWRGLQKCYILTRERCSGPPSWVCWLRLSASIAGSIPGGGILRSHMLCGVAKNKITAKRCLFYHWLQTDKGPRRQSSNVVGSSTGNRVKAIKDTFKDTFKDTHSL